MENQNYASVMGTGIGSTNAPFISSILSSGHSVTFPNYHSYGNGPGLPSISGCSAGCYAALNAGSTYGVSDGNWRGFSGATTIIDRFIAGGITWQAYCEAGCSRGNDHFPFTASSSLSGNPNVFISSSVSTGSFIAAANSATAPSFLWYTPTDSNNMHNNSVPSGDAYLRGFLVGSGTIASPASGSLLASSLFNSGKRTLLILWWDEYDPSPQLFYSPTLLSSSTIDTGNSYTEYSWLSMWEKNWGLTALTSNDAGAVVPNSFGVPPVTCGNGTTNPPACDVCPASQTLVNGVCQTNAIRSGLFTPTATSNSATAWFPNAHSGAPSSSTITSGVLNLLVVNTASSYTGTYNAVAILGCADYCGTPPQTTALAGPPTSLSVKGIFNSLSLSSPTTNDFKVEVSLYFLFASPQSGTTCSAAVTGRTWLDTEVQFSYMSNGVYQPSVNGYIGCGGSSTITYRETESATQPGQPFSITNFNITAFYRRALAMQGLPLTTPASLYGIEPGAEGYGLTSLSATYQYVVGCPAGSTFSNNACTTAAPRVTCGSGATNPPACNVCPASQTLVNGVCTTVQSGTASFTYTPLNPIVGQSVVFLGIASGGIPPYAFSWTFGDNSGSTENPATHIYSTSGTFPVSVTATDADGVSTTSNKTVVVVATLGASITFSPSSPHAGDDITFVGSASGGIQPYNYFWSFGDSRTGSGSSVSHTYQAHGLYAVILTVTDANNQMVNSTETITIKHQDNCHAGCAQSARQTAAFNAIATSGTVRYIFNMVLQLSLQSIRTIARRRLCFVLFWIR